MRAGPLVLSVAVGLLGVASAILGFIAEATKITPDDINVSRSGCVYPATPAFPLALCAVLLLAIAQLISSLAGGCCGCCRRGTGASKSRRLIGILASVLSWIAALVAAAFFLQGAAWNAPATRDAANGGCYFLKGGVFTRAAVLSLVAAALGIVSYFMLTRGPAAMAAGGPKPGGGPYPPGVGMPQWPAQGQGYGGQAQPYPPPAQGYGGQAQQPYSPQPAQGYGGEAPNPQFAAPPGHGHAHGHV